MESVWISKLGLRFLMNSVSKTKQSYFPWHFLQTLTDVFKAECVKLRSIFSHLDYPMGLNDSAMNNFLFRNASAGTAERNADDNSTVKISLPFKDQVAADAVRKQSRDLSHKILPELQPIFVSKKLGQDPKPKEIKPSIVNRQCVVYRFSCNPCFADYVRTQRDTFINALLSRNSRQSVDIS